MAEQYNHNEPHHHQHNHREADKEEMSHDQYIDTILAEKEKKSNDQYGKTTITEVDEDGEKIVTDEVAVAPVETKDRGLFDFLGKKEEEKHKKPQEEVIVTEFEKVKVTEPEPETKECREEEKKPGLLEKLHRSSSSSSSVSILIIFTLLLHLFVFNVSKHVDAYGGVFFNFVFSILESIFLCF